MIASLRAQLKREQQRRGDGILGDDGDDEGDEGAMYVMGGRGRSIKETDLTRHITLSIILAYHSP